MSFLEMTLEGAVIIAVIIFVRFLTIHRLPKKAFLLLWAMALLRLLLPMRISSPVSIYSAAQNLQTVRRSGILLPQAETGEAALASASQALALPVSPWVFIWLTGALLLALGILICHLKSRIIYHTSLPVEHPWIKQWMDSHRLRRPVLVRYSDQIETPLTYGALWPVILLPANMDWSDKAMLGFVLAHEMAHIRRFDALTKWFLAAALCLHWFNPMVWIMYLLANRDLELSCDESVLRLYGTQVKADYALALVDLEERRTGYAPLASSFCKSALKERITAIMKSQKGSAVSFLAAGVLIGIVAAVFAASAPSSKQSLPGQSTLVHTVDEVVEVPDDQAVSFDGEKTATMEVSQNTAAEMGTSSNAPVYTKEEYEQLMKELKPNGYENMSIASFNRSIYAILSRNDDTSFMYEQILSDFQEDDPNAAYLTNTIQASMEEYSARMQEAYSGEQNDPEFYGSAEVEVKNDIFGDKVVTGGCHVEYQFTYRILEQDKLKVKERDAFLLAIMQAMQNKLDKETSDHWTEKTFLETLKSAGKEASGDKISFTGGKIVAVESY